MDINHIPPFLLFLLVAHSNKPPFHAIVPALHRQLLKQGNISLSQIHIKSRASSTDTEELELDLLDVSSF